MNEANTLADVLGHAAPQLRDRVTFTDDAGAEHTAIVTHVRGDDLIDLTVEHGEGNYTSYGSVARAGSGVAGTWRTKVSSEQPAGE